VTWAPVGAILLVGCGLPCESVRFQPVSESGFPEPIQLHGCLTNPDAVGGSVVLVHGFGRAGTDWEPLAARLKAHNVRTLTVDLRGHGLSSGRFPTEHPDSFGVAANDVRGAIQWLLVQPGVDSTRMVLVGASLGGGAVIANALERGGTRFVAWYPGLTYLFRGDSLVNLGSHNVGGLIIQGASDTHPRANPRLTTRFLARNPQIGVIWIPGGRHGAGPDRRRYEGVTVDSIMQWLRR
jgi:dienelactone hydrolase